MRECIKDWAPSLSESSADHVRYYVERGEYEMAYESLVLAAIEENVLCPLETARALLELGKSLHLDTESVFDPNFWRRATGYFGKTGSINDS